MREFTSNGVPLSALWAIAPKMARIAKKKRLPPVEETLVSHFVTPRLSSAFEFDLVSASYFVPTHA